MDFINAGLEWFLRNWDAVLSIGVSLLAAVFTGRALKHTREQKEASQKQANAAQTQANAAEAQVEQMKRQNELMAEQLEQSKTQLGEAIPYVPPWSLKWHKGDTFELVNGGNEREHNVEIEFLTSELFDKQEWDYIDPNSSKTFMFTETFGAPGRDVTVTWSRDSDGEDQHSWEGLIPPKG